MSCPNQVLDLNLIRMLIPYVIPLMNIENYPEGYCDVTSAQILSDRNRLWQIMGSYGAKHRCGLVEGKGHIWVQFGDVNIDFTAHQFQSLIPHVQNIDGYSVLVGSDPYLVSVGYQILPKEQCDQQLSDAGLEIRRNEFGDCSPGIHWCRN